jgi:hypothetical protein
MPEDIQNKEQTLEKPLSGGMRLLRTSLLVAGSALLGGLTVVLWNRSTLLQLRQPQYPAATPSRDEDVEEI